MIDQGKAELDYEKRIKIYHQLQDVIMEDCIWKPLATKDNCVATRKGVEGVQYSPVESHNVHNAIIVEK